MISYGFRALKQILQTDQYLKCLDGSNVVGIDGSQLFHKSIRPVREEIDLRIGSPILPAALLRQGPILFQVLQYLPGTTDHGIGDSRQLGNMDAV